MILDTNIYSALKQNNPVVVGLASKSNRLCLPLPVVAELQFGFMNGVRTVYNQTVLTDFLSQEYVELLSPSLETCEIYAELRLYAQQRGRSLSNNDIWIAALAREDDDVLVTYDKDFEVFQDLFGEKLEILS